MKRTVSKLRRQIAAEAGRLLHERVVTDYHSARQKAVEKLALRARVSADDFPTDREIRRQIRVRGLRDRGKSPRDQSALRLAALRVMRAMGRFQSRVAFDESSDDTALHDYFSVWVFSDDPDEICHLVQTRVGAKKLHDDDLGICSDQHQDTGSTYWKLVPEEISFALRVLPREEFFRTTIHRDWMSPAELDMLVAVDESDLDLSAVDVEGPQTDRYVLWGMLLARLEEVKQDPTGHPEGDALYHSLQAFELARQKYEYDVELITACLLHDVGKAIDMRDHVSAGLTALTGTLSPREEFLIAHHMDALEYQKGTLPQRLKLMLRNSEWFDDLMALRDIDNQARQRGVPVATIEEAIEFIESHEDNYE